jgi:hypothetical protein
VTARHRFDANVFVNSCPRPSAKWLCATRCFAKQWDLFCALWCPPHVGWRSNELYARGIRCASRLSKTVCRQPHVSLRLMHRTSSGVANRPTGADELKASPDPRPSAVLLVARERSLDESCRRTLSDAGVKCVVSVPNSERALEVLGNNKLFDAVVIGVGAGDVEAVKLAQHMRRYRSDTPTVVVSPISNLHIHGAVTQGKPSSSDVHADKSEVFRKLIRRVVGL